ncbi:hypothetical protein KIW84_055161 [Lathyrus oleraceus]|uniref:Uncharacterized protein n=1 Tax=Pisum sativum TaxID=3888 RepID=A0A9D4WXZ6_PEA|nr:hypothetical protein KIW84_055161 [Pisum sativum]
MCEVGHSTKAEIFRYKIEIEVCQSGKCYKFIFWDRECSQLLGVSVALMRDTMIHPGIDDPLEFPLALDDMLDLEFALKVKWQPRWDSCSVVMILRDELFIKQLKAPWEQIQDLEITSKHNPDPVAPTSKRQIPDGSSESKTLVSSSVG